MQVQIAPTLGPMAEIYGLSPSGGVKSERFVAYQQAVGSRMPLQGYNPMTSDSVVETIRALIAVDAETVALAAANETADSVGLKQSHVMHITVATPGMWTDRFGTEVEHRLKVTDPTGILLWADAPVSISHIREEVIAQVVRLKATVDRGGLPPATLAQAVEQEGTALALAGQQGEYNQTAAQVLSSKGADPSLATMVGFLYGADSAASMGYTSVGLNQKTGYRHAIAVCS